MSMMLSSMQNRFAAAVLPCVFMAVFSGSAAAAPEQPWAGELHAVGVYEGTPSAAYEKAYDKIQKPFYRCLRIGGKNCIRVWRRMQRKIDELNHAMPPAVDVSVSRTGAPLNLFLSAYDPVEWRLNIAPGVQIASVLLSGYYRQWVSGLPAGTPVADLTRESDPDRNVGASFYTDDSEVHYRLIGYTRKGRGKCSKKADPNFVSEFLTAQQVLKDYTGLDMTGAQGAYRGGVFQIDSAAAGNLLSRERESGYCYMDHDGVIRPR